MGYFGRITVGRSSTAIDGVTVLEVSDLGGGWWWTQYDGNPEGGLETLVAASGAPALWAYVIDSDCADVEGLTPSGVRWHTYLHPDMAADYDAPPLSESPEEVLEQVLRWAAEAGLAADADTVRRALGATNVFVEETLEGLVVALGLPVGRQDKR